MTGETLEAPLPEPLSGYRVVDMTTAVQGPAAGLYLSDMGAEVIKVERPTGEATRFLRASLGRPSGANRTVKTVPKTARGAGPGGR